MKTRIFDSGLGFVAALFFALVLPLLLRGGLGFLGYSTLSSWLPGLMGSFGGALFGELVLYLILSAIVFLLYRATPLYKRMHTGGFGAALGWFFLGNIIGYGVFGLIVAVAFSSWRGPML